MFFVSEEFLRKHKAGEEFDQTIDKAVPIGHELFESTDGKGKHNVKKRVKKKQDSEQVTKRDPDQS